MKKRLTNLFRIMRLPEMLILPGNLAFFLVLSLVPLVTLLGITASFFSLSTESIGNFFGIVLPGGVADLLAPFLNSGLNTSNFIFIIIGFYVASNGTDSLIVASNILYKNKNSNYLSRKIKALFMNFWLILLFLIILIIMAFGSFILTKIMAFGSLGNFILKNYALITAIKFLFAFVSIFMTIKIIYTLAPDIKLKSKYVNMGTLFATVFIMLVTSIYSFYVTNVAHYDVIYGSLATIATLMLLIYLISYIIVLGIAINYNYYENEINN